MTRNTERRANADLAHAARNPAPSPLRRSTDRPPPPGRRLGCLILVVVAAVAFVALFVGLREVFG
jgi:hypothetical protein